MTTTNPDPNKAYIVTGPTSGIGYQAALELAKHGTVVLVARNEQKLDEVRTTISQQGGRAVCVVCDVSDVASVRRAAGEILALRLPIVGLLNNAGMMTTTKAVAKSAQGWDLTFATNHVGPFALTEALAPHLTDGANVVFVASAIEDPERKPAKAMGMRGGRYLSAEASVRGEWDPGGASMPGVDAYATSKQALLASMFAFARATPRLRFNAVEPGITPGTRLGGANPVLKFIFGQIVTRLPPFGQFRSTPERAGKLLAKVLTDDSKESGVYYDEKGQPMKGSARVLDREFQDRVAAETRALLATVPA